MSAEILPFATNAPTPRPHNTEAEQALLGAVLVNNKAFHLVADKLKADHFHDAVHGRIFAAIEEGITQGQAVTPVTLKGRFDRDGALAEIGGSVYLARLAASAVTIINAPSYADAIVECWRRRRLIDTAERLAEAAADEAESDADTAIRAAEETFHELSDPAAKGLLPMSDALANAIRAAEEGFKAEGRPRGLLTGLADLDAALGGLHKQDLVIIAGRPSMGKSALAFNIAQHVASNGHPVAFPSLEMSAEQLAMRALAGETAIGTDMQRRGTINVHQMTDLIEASNRLRDLPLYIDDSAGATVSQVHSRCIRLKRRHGLALVVIDYLQLMVGGRTENRVQEISAITRDLKRMAKDLDVPVIALSQLSRAVEQREDKRPQLSDLRESGSIEQDADVVMFCFREEYYLEKAQPQPGDFEDQDRFDKAWRRWADRLHACRGVAELLIRKNRMGPTPTVKLHFDPVRTRFGNLARGE